MKFKKASTLFKGLISMTLVVFVSAFIFADLLRVENSQATVMGLPQAGTILKSTGDYDAACLKGLKLDPQNPLNIDFIVDTGDQKQLSEEDAQRLIRYFMAALTIPEEELWVNLSPYENDRIASDTLSDTDMGRDLLAQDYILKQMSSSLTDPDTDLGKDYWSLINSAASSADTFNKIWIVPGEIEVLENETTAVLSKAGLDVMTEADYLAMENNLVDSEQNSAVKDLILPKIREEVNNGKNFSLLRQVYNSILMGMWFKLKFKESFYKDYFNKAKIEGIDLEDESVREKIYAQYVKAFEKGVYDKIKKVYDPLRKTKVKRRYFSGGAKFSSAIQEISANSHFADYSTLSSSLAIEDTVIVSSGVKTVEETKAQDEIVSFKAFVDGYREGDGILFMDIRNLGKTDKAMGATLVDWEKAMIVETVRKTALKHGVAVDNVGQGSDEFYMGILSVFTEDDIADFVRAYNKRVIEELSKVELNRFEFTFDIAKEMEQKLAKLKEDGEIIAYEIFKGKKSVKVNMINAKGKTFDLPASPRTSKVPHPSLPAVMFKAQKGEKYDTTVALVSNALSEHKEKRGYKHRPLLYARDFSQTYQEQIGDDRIRLSQKTEDEGSVMPLFESYSGNNLTPELEADVNSFVAERSMSFRKLLGEQGTWARNLIMKFGAKDRREIIDQFDKFGMLPRSTLGRVIQMVIDGEISSDDVDSLYFKAPPNIIVRLALNGNAYSLSMIDSMVHLGSEYERSDLNRTQLYGKLAKSVANEGRKADSHIVVLESTGENVSPEQAEVNEKFFNFRYDHYGNKGLNEAYSYEGADFIIKATLKAIYTFENHDLGINLLNASKELNDIFVHDTTFVSAKITSLEASEHARLQGINEVGAAISAVEKLLEVRDYVLSSSRNRQVRKKYNGGLVVRVGPIIKRFSDYFKAGWNKVESEYELAKAYQQAREDNGMLEEAGEEFLDNLDRDLGLKVAASAITIDHDAELSLDSDADEFFISFIKKYKRDRSPDYDHDKHELKRIWKGIRFMHEQGIFPFDREEFLYVADTLLANMPEKMYGDFVVQEETFFVMQLLQMLKSEDILNDAVISIENEPSNTESTRAIVVSTKKNQRYKSFKNPLIEKGRVKYNKENNKQVKRSYKLELGGKTYYINLSELVAGNKEGGQLTQKVIDKFQVEGAVKAKISDKWASFRGDYVGAEHNSVKAGNEVKLNDIEISKMRSRRGQINFAGDQNLSRDFDKVLKIIKHSDSKRAPKEPLVGLKFQVTNPYESGEIDGLVSGFEEYWSGYLEDNKDNAMTADIKKIIDESIGFTKNTKSSPWTYCIAQFMNFRSNLQNHPQSAEYLNLLKSLTKQSEYVLSDEEKTGLDDFKAHLKSDKYIVKTIGEGGVEREATFAIDLSTQEIFDASYEQFMQVAKNEYGIKANDKRMAMLRQVFNKVMIMRDEQVAEDIKNNVLFNPYVMMLIDPTIWQKFISLMISSELSVKEGFLKLTAEWTLKNISFNMPVLKTDAFIDIVTAFKLLAAEIDTLDFNEVVDARLELDDIKEDQGYALFLESDIDMAQFQRLVKDYPNIKSIIINDMNIFSMPHYAILWAVEKNIAVITKPYFLTQKGAVSPFDIVEDNMDIIVRPDKRVLTINPTNKEVIKARERDHFDQVEEQLFIEESANELKGRSLKRGLRVDKNRKNKTKTADNKNVRIALHVAGQAYLETITPELGQIDGIGLLAYEMFMMEKGRAYTETELVDMLSDAAERVIALEGRSITTRFQDRQMDENDSKDWPGAPNEDKYKNLYGAEYLLALARDDHEEIRSFVRSLLLAHEKYRIFEVEMPMVKTVDQAVELKGYVEKIKNEMLASEEISISTFTSFEFGIMGERPEIFAKEAILELLKNGIKVQGIGQNDLSAFKTLYDDSLFEIAMVRFAKDNLIKLDAELADSDKKRKFMKEVKAYIASLDKTSEEYMKMDAQAKQNVEHELKNGRIRSGESGRNMKNFRMQEIDMIREYLAQIGQYKGEKMKFCGAVAGDFSMLMWTAWQSEYLKTQGLNPVDLVVTVQPSQVNRAKAYLRRAKVGKGSEAWDLFTKLYEKHAEGDDSIMQVFQGEMDTVFYGIRHDIEAEVKERIAQSSSIKGGVDFAGAQIGTAVGSSAIELATVDLGDFSGLSFSINGMSRFNDQESLLAYLSR